MAGLGVGDTAKIAALVLPLAVDTFVVSATLGLGGPRGSRRYRLGALFALFEGGMPMVGLLLGAPLGRAIGDAADYLAGAILVAFGVHAMLQDEDGEETRVAALAAQQGWRVVALGLAVSLDELAIGFSLGLLRLPVAPVLVLIALQAFLVSQLGLALGSHITARVREAAERIAAVAFVALGVALVTIRLLQH